MEEFKLILERLHYLNSPYLSGLSAFSVILIGLFVLWKNPKSATSQAFCFFTGTIFWWFTGNTFSMLYYTDFNASLFWYRVGYSIVPFMSVAYYNFYLTQLAPDGKNKRFLYYLVLIGLIEVFYLWASDDVRVGAYPLPHVGVVWKGMPFFSYFLTFGMLKYFIVTVLVFISFFKAYRREANPLKKQQLKTFSIGFFVIIFGCTEWLVSFNIPLHIAWLVIPFFFVIFAYAIIHYKAMEIDTVVHKTILWLMTVLLLALPGGIIAFFMDGFLKPLSAYTHIGVISLYLIFFVLYFNWLRPGIDHWFRRRKYDYQTILGKVTEKIVASINVEEITSKLLTEISDIMYLRNSVLFTLSKVKDRFVLIGRKGYKDKTIRSKGQLEIFTQETRSSLSSAERELGQAHLLFQWLMEKKDIMEKDRVEVDPQYAEIKEEAMKWLNDLDIELIIPIIYQNQVNALLGLGKKENLRTYKKKDIELLGKLSQEIGLTVYNALHYQDMAERERLEQELLMGRQIQMSLLPVQSPHVDNLILEGFMLPAREIGGDYYDFIPLPQKNDLGIVIGDVSGKGVAAGLCMAMVKTSVHIFASREGSPKKILLYINQVLNQHMGGEKFMTMLYLIWEAKKSTITYSSAGHEHILVYHQAKNDLEVIQSGGIILGIMPDIDSMLQEKQIKLERGDRVLLYTDGITEAHNQQNDRFGLERLKKSFQHYWDRPTKELIQLIKNDVYDFIGPVQQYDDITLVAMEAQ